METFLSTVFIESQFSNKSSLTYLKSFLIIRDLCKNYGGNLPSTQVLSLATGLSTKTIKRHINYYLSKNWIKINLEKETDFTLNKLYFIININSTCAAKGVKIPQEAYLHTTVQQFTAYLSEAVYTAKHYYHVNKEKNELKKVKSKKEISNYAFNRFFVNQEHQVNITKAKISKTNKLRVVHIHNQPFTKNSERFIKPVCKVLWFDFKNPYTCKTLWFVKDEVKKELVDNLLLKVTELTQISMTNIQESKDKCFSMQQSLSYRAKAISRSKTTVKKYQQWFSTRYTKDKMVFVSSFSSFEKANKRNEIESQNGKYINTSKGLFYSPCTVRTIKSLNIVKRRF